MTYYMLNSNEILVGKYYKLSLTDVKTKEVSTFYIEVDRYLWHYMDSTCKAKMLSKDSENYLIPENEMKQCYTCAFYTDTGDACFLDMNRIVNVGNINGTCKYKTSHDKLKDILKENYP